MYEFADDTVTPNYQYGLNEKVFLTKMEYNAEIEVFDGSKVEGIEILLEVNGSEKKMNIYPITKVTDFNNGNVEITDNKHKLFKDARRTLVQRLVHLLKCFVGKDEIMATLAIPANTFKDLANRVCGLLPKNFSDKEINLFMNYQWNISPGQDKTYLQFPKKIKHGAFFCAASESEGNWRKAEIVMSQDENGDWAASETHFNIEGEEEPVIIEAVGKKTKLDLSTGESLMVKGDVGLFYFKIVDGNPEIHPFTRTTWFCTSNFGKKQEEIEEVGGDW